MSTSRSHVRAIALDLEGTIINLEPQHHDAHLAVAFRLGISLDHASARRLIPGFVGGGDRRIAEGIHKLADGQKSAEWVYEQIRSEFRSRADGLEKIPLRPGFGQFLDSARVLGLRLAIGSLTPAADAVELLAKAGLERHFPSDLLVFAEHVERLKPAPDVYLETARRLRVSPQEQLVFEDSVHGVLAAVAAGSRVVAVPTIHEADFVKALATAGASVVVNEWTEVELDRMLVERKVDE